MKKMVQRIFKPKILLLVFWLAAVFVAIATMPNIEQIATNQAVSQITKQPKEQTNAAQMQAKWGRGLNQTNQMTLVFQNEQGSLTKQQQQQITKIVAGLKRNAAYFNITHIRSIQSSQSDQHNLLSPDGSTELVELAIDRRQTRSPILAMQLQRAGKVPGLKTYATSTELIQYYQSLQQLIDSLIIVTIVALVLTILLGIVFKSILLPLVYLLTSAISGIVAMNVAGNANTAWHWSFDQNSVLLISLTALITVAWITWCFARQTITNQLPAKQVASRLLKNGWLAWITIILLSGGLFFTKLISVASLALIGFTVFLAGVSAWTINYAFAAFLGVGLQWPSQQPRSPKSRILWHQLSHFSLWQPIWAVIIGLVILISNASLITQQFSFNDLSDRAGFLSNGPLTGNQVINDHFGAGKTTPVTIYLQNNQSLTSQKALQTIDSLTTKLQHVKGVASVTSVTQPAGTRFEQYYVGNQLNTVQSNLTAVQDQLARNQKQLKSDQKKITSLKIQTQIKNLKTVQKQVTSLNKLNTRISTQLDQASSRSDNLSGKTKRQRRIVSNLRRDLDQAQAKATSLDNLLTTISDNQSTLVSDYQFTHRSVKSLAKQLQTTSKSLGQINSNVKQSATFIKGLKTSAVGNMFYITDSAYNSDLFTQSLTANTSATGKITKLVVTLKQAPTTPQSLASITKLRSTVQSTLLASPIAQAKIGFQGVPVEQSAVQHIFKANLLQWWLLSLGIMLIVLWVGLRSALVSQIVTGIAALVTLASTALAQAVNSLLLQQGNLNWQTPLLASILIETSLLLLVTPLFADRIGTLKSADLQSRFSSAGQDVLPITSILIIGLVPLLWAHNPVLMQTSMTILISLILILILTPLIMPGWLFIANNPIKINWQQLFKRHPRRHQH